MAPETPHAWRQAPGGDSCGAPKDGGEPALVTESDCGRDFCQKKIFLVCLMFPGAPADYLHERSRCLDEKSYIRCWCRILLAGSGWC